MCNQYFSVLLSVTCGICNAQGFTNPSVENWGVSTTCDINTAPDTWSDYSDGGIGFDEANFSLCATTIPSYASNGNVYARASAQTPTSGEGMFQIVTGLAIGTVYQISFDYAGSNLYGGTNDMKWHLFIDDNDVNQTPVFHSYDSSWTTHSFSFTATAASHKIGFRAYTISTSGAGSAAIDNFTFSISNTVVGPSNMLVLELFPNPFQNELKVVVDSDFPCEISLFDISSRKLMELEFVKSATLNTEELPAGVYFFEIRCGYEIGFRKLVKQ